MFREALQNLYAGAMRSDVVCDPGGRLLCFVQGGWVSPAGSKIKPIVILLPLSLARDKDVRIG